MKKFTRYIAFAFFMLVLLMPAMQQKFGLLKVRDLNGAYILAEMPSFSWNKWLTGDFQEKFEIYLEDHIGFRNMFVRVINQLDFSLYKKTNAEGIVVGKKDYLYEYDYIRDYTGKDFVGMEFIRKKMLRAKYVQHYLEDSLGIHFVIVLEPGKASFYPEFIPDEYVLDSSEQTNYKAYKSLCEELGIKYMDWNQYFMQLKGKTEYPLFPRYGTHWSEYGMTYAADSMLSYIENASGRQLRKAEITGFETSRVPEFTDNDVEKTLNLLCSLPSWVYAYPQWKMDTLSNSYRPYVLTVADSYYWNIFNTRIPKNIFANEAFWYFNGKVYPDTYLEETWVKDLNLKNEVEKQDFIFLMVTERFMHKFDWRFIDMVYELYAPKWLKDPVYEKINRIVLLDEWFNKILNDAKLENMILENKLIREAKFLYKEEDRVSYMIDFGIEYYSNLIEGDTAWYATIVTKAKENGVSEKEQLRLDANYMFFTNERDLYEIHRGTSTIAKAMEDDLDQLDSLQEEALQYGSPLKDYIWRKARMLYREQEIEKTERAIRSTPNWLNDVSKKAAERGIPLDSMIREDAVYVWNQRLKK